MKCPNCGAEMKEGLLYCEYCGEDIHIVPDFEPELEQNIEQSLKDIVKSVSPSAKQSVTDGQMPEHQTQSEQTQQKDSKVAVGWCALALFVIVILWAGVKIFHFYSLDYQLAQAATATANAQYERAIGYYERAMELDRTNVDLKLKLAQVYFLKNDKESYEYWLRQVAEDPRTESEQLESVYGKLIAIYKAREDYQTINDMLVACQLESIREAYRTYIAEMPIFSVPDGEYDEVKALKLTAEGKGKIYYTMDGQVPDANSEIYTSPILLEDGDYDIKALYVNENGIHSKVAEAWYHIAVTELEPPELNIDSGEYNSLVFITVTNDTSNIYYTTDGTIPTTNSIRYTEPIPLPLGESNFYFARLENGQSSVVVDRSFTFTLHTDITPAIAVDKVRENELQSGKIIDNNGHFDEDSEDRYLYHYLNLMKLEGQDTLVYVVAEVLEAEGRQTRTGIYFAVDVFTGELYHLQSDSIHL
ncbi:MAG: chitobiase/beta-hexosaminidase C-terminal domain-containing protein [Lachnospiraceae bacterium]|nr:chitobiase/beta-hexosaminidase C-terminal domain-containing protein [Lachnospiraceae bacterium]